MFEFSLNISLKYHFMGTKLAYFFVYSYICTIIRKDYETVYTCFVGCYGLFFG
jgi:hypothetical protein